ncbi:hypothetical protein [Aliarcobacter cryaerophilus]|uniref:hypothetical protein n=1 Tax=Aliarcobacter cryaerophilus TaxID=28198 RepID=UPI0021B336E0|nr:hypothetical protein [Aliarcobacter cryaerophilus]MCT7507004.1 hypothetical protein [Aliarcobacter cryaerophilus]
MKKDKIQEKFIEIFNRNIPLDEEYSIEEIKEAFLKVDNISANEREKELYFRFFTECAKEECVKDLIEFSGTTSTKLKKLYKSFKYEKKLEFGRFWEKRFRINKDDSIFPFILSRKEGIYKEIENFEQYELTPCIAYEMAIRNKEVKELLLSLEIVSNMMKKNKYLYKRIYREETFYELKENNRLINEYKNMSYEEYIDKVFEKISSYSDYFKEFPVDFVNSYIKKCTELSFIELKELKKVLENKLIHEYLIYPTGYKRKLPYSSLNNLEIMESLSTQELKEISEVNENKNNQFIVDNDFKMSLNPNYKYKELNQCLSKKITYKNLYNENLEEITNSHKEKTPMESCYKYDLTYERTVYKEFIQIQSLATNKQEFTANNIIPNFKRQVNDQEQMVVPINFSLPIEEIVEYITKIKENINQKSPLELMGEKLNKAPNITIFYIKKNDKFEDLPFYLADLIYIYDMKKKGFSHQDIINELNANHEKIDAIRNDIINHYYNLAKDYIENKKYKEFITGKIEKI